MKVFPGQKVASSSPSFTLGSGLYERDGFIFASISGILIKEESAGAGTGSASLRIGRVTEGALTQVIPVIGQVVLGRVVKLTARYAGVDILSVDGQAPLMESIKGTIRIQDIVSVEEKEVPAIQQAFRPGDLIRARVIGLGDPSAGFLLSTGVTAELGVVYGKSAAAGAPLLPAAWNEMICSQTGIREKRKCAKPLL